MKEILVTGSDLNKVCRLCLSSDAIVIDIFRFSTELEDQPSNVIMKCAPVQITRHDEMPNFICRLCYAQLEKFHQFQIQVVQSDKTLRNHLEQSCASDIQSKSGYSIEKPSEDVFVHNTHSNVKCEPLELDDVFDANASLKGKTTANFTSTYETNEMIFKIKNEPIDNNSLKCDVDIFSKDDDHLKCETKLNEDNCKEKRSANKTNDARSSKSDMKSEPSVDSPLFQKDYVGDTVKVSSDCGGSEINYEDQSSENFACVRTADTTEYFEEGSKNVVSKLHQCNMCGMWFARTGDLKRHKRLHSGHISYQCDVCNKHFTQLGNLKSHKRTHTGEKPYQCDICNKRFTKNCNLKNHKLLHADEKPYRCNICNKQFSQANSLLNHERIHTEEKQYQCDVCDKGFRNLWNLKIHKRTHTGEKPYHCNVCNMSFSLPVNLKTHKRTHTGEKPYQCDVCDKSFNRSDSLNSHKFVHADEKPYRCDTCNKSFTRSSYLNTHKRTHTGEKPYQCDVCNKCFGRSDYLNNHKLLHGDEKPFHCDVCDKSFTKASNLNNHKLTHTGNKLFQCGLCEKSFTRSNYLNIHKRTHTGEKPY